MSVWRRLQRVGKKAARFEFTLSLQHCTLQCHQQYIPGNLVVVFTRRSRRHSSKPFKCSQSMDDTSVYNYVWPMPDNMVFTTTLYRGEKTIQFEEKAWTCQVEDVGNLSGGDVAGPTGGTLARGRLFPGQSVRRRVLATRQIDLSEFASGVTCQQNLCIQLRMATKHMLKASITLTLNSVIVKEGEATDEDMISVASLMSLSRAGSFGVGSGLTINDVGAFSPPTLPRFASGRFGRFPGTSGSIGNFHGGGGGGGGLDQVRTRLERLEVGASHETGRQAGDGKKVDDDVEEDATAAIFSSNRPVETPGTPSMNSRRGGYQVSVSTMSLSNTGDSIGGRMPRGFHATMPTQSSQDLLSWCQQVTKGYQGVHITNLTTSFQSGLAFCAILHHFFPDRIQYPSQPVRSQAVENCRLAFEVAAKLGVPRVLDPAEITSLIRPPDLLSMMTYLHQIRTRCCPEEASTTDGARTQALVNHQPTETDIDENPTDRATASSLPVTTDDNRAIPPSKSYRGMKGEADDEGRNSQTAVPVNGGVGQPAKSQKQSTASAGCDRMLAKAQLLLEETRRKKTVDGQPPLTDSLPPVAHPRRIQKGSGRPPSTFAPSEGSDMSGTGGGRLTVESGPVEVVSGDAGRPPTRSGKASHRRQLMRFNSDGTVHTSGLPSPDPANAKSPQPVPQTPPAPAASVLDDDDDEDVTDVKVQRLRLSQFMLFDKGRGSGAPMPIRIGEHRLKPGGGQFQPNASRDPHESGKPLANDSGRVDDSGPSNEQVRQGSASPYRQGQLPPLETPPYSSTTADYISNEQDELERAQRELDEEASGVEQRLRVLMSRNQNSEVVDRLLRRWFVLVNRKNALTRRGIQLSIMEKEEDLQKKMHMLQSELHEMSKIEDYLKTEHDRKREELLLRDLVHMVNTRDDLIHQLDIEEQGLAEDLRLSSEHALRHRPTDKGCVLQ